MKKMLLSALVLSSLTAGATDISGSTTQVLMSPTQSAIALLQGTAFASAGVTVLSIMSSYQSKGVAAREELKDEMPSLNEDMVNGRVKTLEDVRQPALREFFFEIASDEKAMREVEGFVPRGSRLEKISTAVAAAILLN